MKKKESISSDLTVKEILDRYPQTLRIFMDMGVFCVGCPAEAFHSLADVARENQLNLKQFLQSIFDVIAKDSRTLDSVSPENNGKNTV